MAKIVLLVDNMITKQALQMIQDARKEILISTYKFGLVTPDKAGIIGRVYEELEQAVKRGVDVHILLHIPDNHAGPSGINTRAGRILAAAGINVHTLKNNRTAHAKIICVDRYAVIIGSHNLTLSSWTRNSEISVYINSPAFAQKLAITLTSLIYGH